MRVTLVWAQGSNGVIGKNGGIPWRIPEDLVRFKKLTYGHSVLMGRKTWDSFPAVVRPLPGRKNYVISSHTNAAPGGVVVHNPHTGILACAAADCRELFVIGGTRVYNDTIGVADRLIVTHIPLEPEGDTYAPFIDKTKWAVVDAKYFTSVDKLTSSEVNCCTMEYHPKTT